MTLSVGCHLSISQSGGYEGMGQTACRIGATTFAFFTRNPRGGSARKPDPDDMKRLNTLMEQQGFGKLVAHAPYTLNLCSAKPDVIDFARRAMREDLGNSGVFTWDVLQLSSRLSSKTGSEVGCSLIAEGSMKS